MAKKDDLVRQLKNNRHLLKRHVTATMKEAGGREVQNSRVRDKSKRISHMIGSLAAQRKELHGSFVHLQKCVDPHGKFVKDFGPLKKETHQKKPTKIDEKTKAQFVSHIYIISTRNVNNARHTILTNSKTVPKLKKSNFRMINKLQVEF